VISLLDFDGVLHDCEVFLESSENVFKAHPRNALFEYLPLLE
jgi:3-deoxy-D-manno-octulosonate 8-phosphate phosphatase KdsC-like HAD superfamily phosphatase